MQFLTGADVVVVVIAEVDVVHFLVGIVVVELNLIDGVVEVHTGGEHFLVVVELYPIVVAVVALQFLVDVVVAVMLLAGGVVGLFGVGIVVAVVL